MRTTEIENEKSLFAILSSCLFDCLSHLRSSSQILNSGLTDSEGRHLILKQARLIKPEIHETFFLFFERSNEETKILGLNE